MFAFLLLFSAPSYGEPQARPSDEVPPVPRVVRASWYGERFRGKKTASGELFDPDKLTAAHKTFPFGTLLKVSSPRTGRSVVVRVNDRGPYVHGRTLDLSKRAAVKLGIEDKGVDTVVIERL